MELSVATGTFGHTSWTHLARQRVLPSVLEEGVPWVHVHGDSLHDARNRALARVETEWVVFVDADDELEPGYVEAMSRGVADVRGPVVRYVRNGRLRPLWQPRVAGHTHDCEAACLREGNWVVIGAAVRTEMLRKVGGWHDFPWSEDWASWALCWKAGASFELVRDAVYRAHVNPQSRNRGALQADRLAAHREIEAFVWPEELAA